MILNSDYLYFFYGQSDLFDDIFLLEVFYWFLKLAQLHMKDMYTFLLYERNQYV